MGKSNKDSTNTKTEAMPNPTYTASTNKKPYVIYIGLSVTPLAKTVV
jgi:hypothetical protein